MAQPPPPAVRYLVLVAVIALLGLAVCAKTEKANHPSPPITSEPASEPPEATAVEPAAAADAGPASAVQQTAVEPTPAQNPAPSAVDKGASKDKGNTTKPQEEFFPATKSGGMF